MTLAETQALFRRAITSAEPLPPKRLEACFAGSDALPAAERVSIYAEMYLSRLTEALRVTYPNLSRLLGDGPFAALSRDYLRRYPSRHHDVGEVGRKLATFLRRYPDPERPDLADLAELEWARQEVFFAPPVAPKGAELLSGLSPEAFLRTGLALSPALRLLVLDHDATALWRRIENGEPADPPRRERSVVAVWRNGFEVFHGALAADEALALEGAARGLDLARICAAFAAREDPAEAAHAALASWFAEGWIVGLAAGALARRGRRKAPAQSERR